MSEFFDDCFEINYLKFSDVKHRRLLGQYFTPPSIALFMAEWIIHRESNYLRILDPSTGFGVFERAISISQSGKNYHIRFDLWEIDEAISKVLKQISDDYKIDAIIHNEDFLNSDWHDKYDGIIANPPYFEHRRIKNKTDLYNLICKKTAHRFSIQTNIYCWFLIKCLNQLAENGRLAFIVPSDFLNANYGDKVKQYLLQSGYDLSLINIDYTENLFEDAYTTSLIILAEKTKQKTERIRFYYVSKNEKLTNITDFLNTHEFREIRTSVIDPKEKWKNYFNGNYERYKSKILISFSNLGKFTRGIATGANDFFMLSIGDAEKYKIPNDALLPCISKANDVKGIIFTKSDYQLLISEGRKVLLFNGMYSNDKNISEYIKLGEYQGTNLKYLTKTRKPWYSLEKREVSPIWAAVFGRNGLKFIWNESECLTLTCFHVFYPSEIGKKYLDILFIYLNSEVAFELFENEKREYGGGLGKFEPNDITKALYPDFGYLSRGQLDELKLLQRYFIDSGSEEERKYMLNKADQIFRHLINNT